MAQLHERILGCGYGRIAPAKRGHKGGAGDWRARPEV